MKTLGPLARQKNKTMDEPANNIGPNAFAKEIPIENINVNGVEAHDPLSMSSKSQKILVAP